MDLLTVIAASRRRFTFDADALDYIGRVEAADGAALESHVKMGMNGFFLALKAGSLWDALEGSALLMAGPRTLAGALVPLKPGMASPTNVGFVEGDYNRWTGLVGDGSAKCLYMGVNNNAMPQNDRHMAVYYTQHHTLVGNKVAMGMGGATAGVGQLITSSGVRYHRLSNALSTATPQGGALTDSTTPVGLWSASRSNGTELTARFGGTDIVFPAASSTPTNGEMILFARGVVGSPNAFSNGRIAWASFGRGIDGATMEAAILAYLSQL